MLEINEMLQCLFLNQEECIKVRRHLHEIPELGLEEYETTEYIEDYLKKQNIDPIRLDPTGVTAYIGPKEAPVIGLRADMDGLAIREETGLPFASKHIGRMHACGHDGHMAGLLAAARVLKQFEKELPVRVKLIFEPSEENTLGAKKIIEGGILDDVEEIFGLHLFSDIPCGTISLEKGPRMAQTDRFTITFHGVGGHAGKPHLCVDATVMAAEFVISAQSIVAREVNPAEGAVVTIGSLHSGTQYNIISPKAVLSGTCRSFSVETARKLQQGLERRARSIADSFGGQVEIDYDFGSHPPVINEEAMTCRVLESAREFLPEQKYETIAPLMLGEDFSWYQDQIPGVFAFVGCGREEGVSYPNHHPKFDIEEKSLPVAAALYLAAVHSFVKKKA